MAWGAGAPLGGGVGPGWRAPRAGLRPAPLPTCRPPPPGTLGTHGWSGACRCAGVPSDPGRPARPDLAPAPPWQLRTRPPRRGRPLGPQMAWLGSLRESRGALATPRLGVQAG